MGVPPLPPLLPYWTFPLKGSAEVTVTFVRFPARGDCQVRVAVLVAWVNGLSITKIDDTALECDSDTDA